MKYTATVVLESIGVEVEAKNKEGVHNKIWDGFESLNGFFPTLDLKITRIDVDEIYGIEQH